MKRHAIIIDAPKHVRLIEEPLPEKPLNPHECLLETRVSMISPGTELSRAFGLKPGATYPVYPGYCSVGVIRAKGEGLSAFEVGDRVLFSGPHASLQVFDVNRSDGGVLYRLDPRLSDEEGAFLMMGWIAMNGILNAEVKLTDTVAIYGLGNLGLVLALLYKAMGVKVIGLDPVKERANTARTAGLVHIVDGAPAEQVKAVMALTEGRGADIVVDATGLSAAIVNAIASAAKHGQVILLGSPREAFVTDITPTLNTIHMKLLKVIGALNRGFPYEEAPGSRLSIHKGLNTLSELLITKTLDINLFITHRIAPQDIWSAYDALMNDKAHTQGIIIQWKN
jgi:2-desacetyl-2-hydroxyethyl bacteriochlorophyllide A dehydrogenase